MLSAHKEGHKKVKTFHTTTKWQYMSIPAICKMYVHVHVDVHTMIPRLYPPQGGDSAVIGATLYHRPEALRELVAVGANLNLRNQVKFQLLWQLHHVSSPAVHIRKV